ncbi:MAG: DivIVA domain-containing protein [Mycoplasma sp.]
MSQKIIKYLEDVTKKKFSTKHQGYDPLQVDETLDEIIMKVNELLGEWNDMCDKYHHIQEKNDTLTKELISSMKENSLLQGKIDHYESSGFSSAIVNERLNMLENIVKDPSAKNKND